MRQQIEADATVEEVRAIDARSRKRSGVFDIMANHTNVTVDLV